ncbi:AH receptor-interacting protein isoform X2 [Oratosquilla oratoria]|uniref:AH receptor-interacting protein isoform X2 n=1 Tax=Oratosquilla oratoria TaxID=337810 RepID=UPI003F75F2BC
MAGKEIQFHYKCETCAEDPLILDDSRVWGQPVDLLLGKQFKLEVWEACIQTMLVNEIAEFVVDKSLLSAYPVVAKTLRQAYGEDKNKKEHKPHSCCGMGFKEGLGYTDLNDLVTEPKDLKFTIELCKVEGHGTYEKEFWAMTDNERFESIPALRENGNMLYKEGKHEEACQKYKEALGRLEQLILREKPGDEEWTKLNNMKMPLLLNYSQCQLLQGENYAVIEHCSTVLQHESENVKALYRRGRAYINVWSPKEAREDLEKAARCDPSLAPACKKLLDELQYMEKKKDSEDKDKFSKLFS